MMIFKERRNVKLNYIIIMVINREFFFRGWLPAGLLINARLNSSSPSDDCTVLRPLISPVPTASGSRPQPPITFPVTQATDGIAILLKDAIPEGAIVMLPTGAWYGPGTPFILATNVWYEGRIQEVSGGDVMSVRVGVDRDFTLNYFSDYTGVDAADVRLIQLPCKWIPGAVRDQRAFKDPQALLNETGYIPKIQVDGKSVALPVMDFKRILSFELAGMRDAYSSQSSSSRVYFIQCEYAAGLDPRIPGTKYFGLIGAVEPSIQSFYSVLGENIRTKIAGADLIKTQWLGVLSTGLSSDQVVSYN